MKEDTSKFINRTSKEYGLYILEHRAIPKVSDGLKDSQRKALYLMMNRAAKIKTVSLSGEMISSGLYLHGDTSATDTIGLLAAPYCNNVTFLHGEGNFGNRMGPKDISPGRYTYVKRNQALEDILAVDKDIMPLKENYDGSNVEPVHFLPLIPTVLLNGISGIAVGWSTDILPRKFKDLVNATLDVIDGKQIKNLKPGYEKFNVTVKNLEAQNQWELTGKCKIEKNSIIVTELPPYTTLEQFKERLNRMEEEGTIRGYSDNSAKEGINIDVQFKRGQIDEWIEEEAIIFLKLREKVTERMVVIGWDNQTVKQYTDSKDIVKEFVDWRLGWYVKRYEKLLADDSYELKYWQALKACFDSKLPSKLIGKKSRKEVEQETIKITGSLDIDDRQLDRIVSHATYKWADDYYHECLKKIKDLEKNIKEWNSYLKSPKKIREIYRNEVANLLNIKF